MAAETISNVQLPDGYDPGLNASRQDYLDELNDPATYSQFNSRIYNEVGDQGPDAQRAFAETVFNRARARGLSLAATINDRTYYPSASFKATPSDADYGDAISAAAQGSNLTSGATGNASGNAGFNGGPQTYSAGGERFGIEGQDVAKVTNVQLPEISNVVLPSQPSAANAPVTQTEDTSAAPIMERLPSRMPTEFEAANAPKAVPVDLLSQAVQASLPYEPRYLAPPPTEPVYQPAQGPVGRLLGLQEPVWPMPLAQGEIPAQAAGNAPVPRQGEIPPFVDQITRGAIEAASGARPAGFSAIAGDVVRAGVRNLLQPEESPEGSSERQFKEGLAQAAGGFAQQMTELDNLALMAATGGLTGGASRAMSGVFAAQMATALPDMWQEFKSAPDLQSKVAIAGQAAATLGAIGLAGTHAIRGGGEYAITEPAAGEVSQLEVRPRLAEAAPLRTEMGQPAEVQAPEGAVPGAQPGAVPVSPEATEQARYGPLPEGITREEAVAAPQNLADIIRQRQDLQDERAGLQNQAQVAQAVTGTVPGVISDRLAEIEDQLGGGAETPQPMAAPPGEAAGAAEKPPVPTQPATVSEEPPSTTSTKNAVVDQERLARGLQPVAADAGATAPETMAKVEERFRLNPKAGQMLVDDLLEGRKREISAVDEGTLVREKIDTQTARAAAGDRALDQSLSDAERAQAKSEFDQLEAYSRRIDEATAKTGSIWSELGNFRQRLFADDYSPLELERRMRMARGPEPISPAEEATIRNAAETAAAKISEAQGKVDILQNRMAAEKTFNDVLRETVAEAKSTRARGGKLTDFTGRKAAEARARLAEKRGRLYTGIDPTVLRDQAIIGADYLARGVTQLADWSAAMLREFGEQIRPYLHDLWVRAKALHNASARALRTPEEIKAERYKGSLARQTIGVQAALERGDYTKRVREQRVLSRQEFQMRSNLQILKNELDSRIAKEAYRNQGLWRKLGEHFVGAERFIGKLSGPEVLGKLGIAGAVRELGLAPVESAVGYGVSRLFPRLAKETRFGAGLGAVVRGELAAKKGLFTQGMKDAWENLKGKESGLDAMQRKYNMSPQFWYHYIGKVHSAIKAPIARAEFERSMAVLTDAAAKAGRDVTNHNVMQGIQDRALAEANRSRFQQNTIVSSWFKQLDRIPVAGRVGRFFAPVVRIPVNIFKELMTLNVGAPVGLARAAEAYRQGIETIPVEQREAIIRQMVKGSVGGAAWLWAYYNRDKVRKFFDTMPRYFQHTPVAMTMNEAANIGMMVNGTPAEQKTGYQNLIFQAKTDVPFVWTLKDAADALDSHSSKPFQRWLYNMTRSTVEPQLVQQVAKYSDLPGNYPLNIITEKPTPRYPQGLAETLMVGVPGLRQQVSPVPERQLVRDMTPQQRLAHQQQLRLQNIRNPQLRLQRQQQRSGRPYQLSTP